LFSFPAPLGIIGGKGILGEGEKKREEEEGGCPIFFLSNSTLTTRGEEGEAKRGNGERGKRERRKRHTSSFSSPMFLVPPDVRGWEKEEVKRGRKEGGEKKREEGEGVLSSTHLLSDVQGKGGEEVWGRILWEEEGRERGGKGGEEGTGPSYFISILSFRSTFFPDPGKRKNTRGGKVKREKRGKEKGKRRGSFFFFFFNTCGGKRVLERLKESTSPGKRKRNPFSLPFTPFLLAGGGNLDGTTRERRRKGKKRGREGAVVCQQRKEKKPKEERKGRGKRGKERSLFHLSI